MLATIARRPRFRVCGWPLELYRLDMYEGYEDALLAVVHDSAKPWGYVIRRTRVRDRVEYAIEREVREIGPGDLDGLRLADPRVESQQTITPGCESMEVLTLMTIELSATVGVMPEPWRPRRRR